jgi:hypothetical protein
LRLTFKPSLFVATDVSFFFAGAEAEESDSEAVGLLRFLLRASCFCFSAAAASSILAKSAISNLDIWVRTATPASRSSFITTSTFNP